MNTTFAQATGRSSHEVKLISREGRRLVRLSGASRARRTSSGAIHPVAFSAIAATRLRRI